MESLLETCDDGGASAVLTGLLYRVGFFVCIVLSFGSMLVARLQRARPTLAPAEGRSTGHPRSQSGMDAGLWASVPLRAVSPTADNARDLRGQPGCAGCGPTRGSHASACCACPSDGDPVRDLRGLPGCVGCGRKQGCHAPSCRRSEGAGGRGQRIRGPTWTDKDVQASLASTQVCSDSEEVVHDRDGGGEMEVSVIRSASLTLEAALDDLVSSGAKTELTYGGPKGKCAMCGERASDGKNLKGCTLCKATWYCSKECQVRWGASRVVPVLRARMIVCVESLQAADWKRGHKDACKLLGKEGLASLSLAEGELPSSRPWRQGFDEGADMDWPDHVEFAGSTAARQTLARTPELRGPMSHVATLVNVGFLAEESRRRMFAAPFPQADIPRARQPAELMPLATTLSKGVEVLARMMGIQGASKTLERMAARGLKRRDAEKPVGFVVLECNDPIEHVLARRSKPTKDAGLAGTAHLVVMYLDDASLRHYIAKRYDENHGASDAVNARQCAQHLCRQLDEAVAAHGSSQTFHLVFYKHRMAPFYLTGCLLGFSKLDAGTEASWSSLLQQLLTHVTPHGMQAAQAAQVTLTLPEVGETAVSDVAFFDLDQANFRVLVGGDDAGEQELEKLAAAGARRVRVVGLVSSPQYNGQEGSVLKELPNGRLSVKLDQGKELSLKRGSLQFLA